MGELIFVGLGLADLDGLTLRAVEAIRNADLAIAEFYTSKVIDLDITQFSKMVGKNISIVSREEVESGDEIIELAKKRSVCFLTAGDPMAATTHVDLRLRAVEKGISTKIIHGVSIHTACASALGLQHYKFGRTVSLPFRERNYSPSSPYEHILENRKLGLHTLILLDIKEEENKYMTAAEGVWWLIDAEKKIGKGLINDKTLICALARIGSRSEKILASYPQIIVQEDMGPPLHTLVLPGKLHFMEARALIAFADAPKEILNDLQMM
ncbi:MAG: diphthine synthase [Methanomassiliicoccales archaeon]